MRIFTILDKMHLFNSLVDAQSTGVPESFAKRLGISRTTLYDIIDDLRSRGVDIKYSRTRCTFYYCSQVSLEIRFTITHLDCDLSDMGGDEMREVNGGSQIISSVRFLARKESTFVLQ